MFTYKNESMTENPTEHLYTGPKATLLALNIQSERKLLHLRPVDEAGPYLSSGDSDEPLLQPGHDNKGIQLLVPQL